MPRVQTKTKIKLGADRKCGRCGEAIEPGQQYRQWSFRYGGTHYRCMRTQCAPRQSDLTQSKMQAVYLAIEDAEDSVGDVEDHEALSSLVEGVADVVREVADEYTEAAEPFGGQGENQERAEELEGWADELESFYPDGDEDLGDVIDDAREVLGGCPL